MSDEHIAYICEWCYPDTQTLAGLATEEKQQRCKVVFCNICKMHTWHFPSEKTSEEA